jgi:DNA helicase-2/ATP-dependent DNA helicase PcrA
LNPRQTEAVEWCEGPELVLAGAGSGKTRVLTAKIAHLINDKSVSPNRIVALTFTNKAAREMLARVKALVGEDLHGMQISTFHSWGLRFLYRNSHILREIGYPPSFVIFDRGDCKNVLKRIAREMGISADEYDASSLLEKVSRAKGGCDPVSLNPDVDKKWLGIYERYESELLRQGALDFDDLMIMPLRILSSREDVLEREMSAIDWMLVDEYQDVNTLQYRLLRLLVGASGRLMVVGDPDQSIYGWRGANMSLILNFESDFAGARVVVLDQNYRSTANILDAANSVIKHNPQRHEKNLWTASERGPKVHALLARNNDEESDFIVSEIEKLVYDGYDYGEIAILYRMNALSRGYEQILLERGIPHRVVRGVAFYDRREIKDVLSMLRLAMNPKDEASLGRIANIPARGIGEKSLAELTKRLSLADGSPEEVWNDIGRNPYLKGKAGRGAAELASIMLSVLGVESLAGAIDFIMYNGGYLEYLRGECPDDWVERVENIRELQSILPEGDIAEALAQAALFTDHETDPGGGAKVSLLTMHAAKGLEFPVVFLIGFEEGIFPSAKSAESQDSLLEERRLCYVGMTRARERLYVSGVMSRLLFGGFQRSKFSRFISEMAGECVKIDDRTKGKRGSDGYVGSGGHGRRWGW